MLKHESSQKSISNSELHATSTMNAGAFFDVCCEVRKRRNDMLEDLAVEASLKYRKIPLYSSAASAVSDHESPALLHTVYTRCRG